MATLANNSALVCPITLCVMMDPVKAPDGHSYERAAIIQAIQHNGVSPLTRQPMSVDQLVTDYTLKSLIDSLVQTTVVDKVPDTISGTIRTSGHLTQVTLHSDDSEAGPQNVVFVVDTSGSMDNEVGASTGEQDGFSILDVTKHGIRTCMCGLRPQDRAAIVTFSTDARMVMPLRKMDAGGKAQLEVALAGINPCGGTNIWAGLELGLQQLGSTAGTIFLLTDGQPNYRPPRGEVTMLKNAMDGCDNIVVNTYGFGYNLDSKLLVELARSTQGSYSFIPDIGTLGTVFVHAMANLGTAVDRSITLNIETEGTIAMPEIVKTNWGYTLPLGRITKGQTRDIFIECDKVVSVTAQKVDELTRSDDAPDQPDCQIVSMGIFQCHGIARMNPEQANTFLNGLMAAVTDPKLQEDLNGQVREAIMSEHYRKWGRHYLPSLALAHWTQQCNNFLDKGIQEYGGATFLDLRDKLDKAFNELPAPTPTHRERVVTRFRSTGRQVTATPERMSSYNSASAPCFAGHCQVETADGNSKPCQDIRKGDSVMTSKGPAEVVCVVKTPCQNSVAKLCKIGRLMVTEWHPISLGGEWKFPSKIQPVQSYPCEFVYSFLLEEGFPDMYIEEVKCITLAHGIKNDDVAEHPFYGTRHVVNSLKELRGWHEGLVVIRGAMRDTETNLVNGLYQ